jgi:hypothetical protein
MYFPELNLKKVEKEIFSGMRIVSNFMETFNKNVSAFCALGNILVSK